MTIHFNNWLMSGLQLAGPRFGNTKVAYYIVLYYSFLLEAVRRALLQKHGIMTARSR